MKRSLFALALSVALIANAAPQQRRAPVVVDLQAVSLAQVVHLVYKEINPSSYVMAPDLVADQRPVSLRWQGLPSELPGFMAHWLDTLGYTAKTDHGTVFIAKTVHVEPKPEAEEPQEVMIYWPRYQSASALRELASGVVPADGFTAHRGVSRMPSMSSGQAMSVQAGPGSRSMRSAQQQPVTATPGSALSMMDKDDRMLVFRGVQKDRDALNAFLAQVDVPAEVISVQGAIYEVSTTKTEGSAFKLAANILRGKFGITANLGAAPGGNWFGISYAGFDAVMGALNSDSRFRVLSAPRLSVRSGGSARLVVGQEVPTAGAVTTTPQGGTLQSVDYKQSGIIFDLQPQVFKDAVRLSLSQQVSSFVRTDTGVNNSPTLLKREAKTDLDVFGNEVVVIGGLVDTKQSLSNSGLPFLPRFMDSQNTDSTGSELLVLLQVTRQVEAVKQ